MSSWTIWNVSLTHSTRRDRGREKRRVIDWMGVYGPRLMTDSLTNPPLSGVWEQFCFIINDRLRKTSIEREKNNTALLNCKVSDYYVAFSKRRFDGIFLIFQFTYINWLLMNFEMNSSLFLVSALMYMRFDNRLLKPLITSA